MFFRKLRNYFLSGLFVVVPIGVTIWIVWGLFNFFDNWYQQLARTNEYFAILKQQNYYIPKHGIGFILTISLITLIGFTTQLYFGKKILNLVDRVFLKIPFISSIYNGLKQVGETIMGRQSKLFERVVILEYPRKGLYSLAFVMSQDRDLVSLITKQNMLYVFVATTPNPTSGYFLIVPENDVTDLNISVEDAMKMIISSGMVAPKAKDFFDPKTLKAIENNVKIL
jgi:uncharacterized membrane protein